MESISFINLLSRGFTSNRLMLSLGPIYCDYSLKDIVINCLVTKEHNSFNIIESDELVLCPQALKL